MVDKALKRIEENNTRMLGKAGKFSNSSIFSAPGLTKADKIIGKRLKKRKIKSTKKGILTDKEFDNFSNKLFRRDV